MLNKGKENLKTNRCINCLPVTEKKFQALFVHATSEIKLFLPLNNCSILFNQNHLLMGKKFTSSYQRPGVCK